MTLSLLNSFNHFFSKVQFKIDVFARFCFLMCSYVPFLPVSGDTVKAKSFRQGYGGKGANQCVAAAKLGSKTVLISKVRVLSLATIFSTSIIMENQIIGHIQVGNDEWGKKYIENLKSLNVDTDYVKTVEGKQTGLAHINVATEGANQIVIIPGANDAISEADIDECSEEVLANSKVCSFVLFLL